MGSKFDDANSLQHYKIVADASDRPTSTTLANSLIGIIKAINGFRWTGEGEVIRAGYGLAG